MRHGCGRLACREEFSMNMETYRKRRRAAHKWEARIERVWEKRQDIFDAAEMMLMVAWAYVLFVLFA